METVKVKKRGRPAQLLQVAELKSFVEYLEKKTELSEVERSFMASLINVDYRFEELSDVHQVLLKEALKPYREHLKLQLLFEELSQNSSHTEYERKFLHLYYRHQENNLTSSETNIMKVMCNRYQKFKAQKLEYKDLEFYLSQIQKKEKGQQRRAENQRKFELGGVVLSIYKVANNEAIDVEKIKKIIYRDYFMGGNLRKSAVYKKVWALDLTISDKYKLLFEAINEIALFKQKSSGLSVLDIAIQKSREKLFEGSKEKDS